MSMMFFTMFSYSSPISRVDSAALLIEVLLAGDSVVAGAGAVVGGAGVTGVVVVGVGGAVVVVAGLL